jgi:hypothetical protein
MKRTTTVAVSLLHFAACLPASADCMGQTPRYVEMKVESCRSAIPLVQSAIVGREYSSQEAKQVEISTAHLYIIRGRPLAEVDLIQWYSQGDFRHYVGRKAPIESESRDFMVISYGGCEPLSNGKPLIFDINPDKPCRDSIAIINGKKPNETDGRLILEMAEVEYIDDQDSFKDMKDARKRMNETRYQTQPVEENVRR